MRSLSRWFQLMNLAEDNERVRRLRRRERGLGDAPRAGSLRAAMPHLAERGVSAGELREMLEGAELRLVMTAHPTEARRRTTVEKLARIFARLRDLDERAPVPDDEAEARRAIAGTIQELWGSDEVRAASPTPLDEVHGGLVYFASTLHRVVPELYRELEAAVEECYPGEGIAVPPLITFGSWMGGDRDGNPNVTAGVTAYALEMMRVACLHLLEARIEVLAQRVSLSERLVGVGDELGGALAALGELFPEEAARGLARNPEEPFRRYFSLVAARVRATRDGRRRRLRRAGRAARRPAARPAAAARRGRGVRRRHAAPRHDPAGRGVRLPLRAARRARARGAARRRARGGAVGARRARGVRVAGVGRALRPARARDRRAAAADPVGPRRVLRRDAGGRRDVPDARLAAARPPRRRGAVVRGVGHRGPGAPAGSAAADEGERARGGRRRGRAAADRAAVRGRGVVVGGRWDDADAAGAARLPRRPARGRRRAGGDDRLLRLQQGRGVRGVGLGDLPRAGRARRGARALRRALGVLPRPRRRPGARRRAGQPGHPRPAARHGRRPDEDDRAGRGAVREVLPAGDRPPRARADRQRGAGVDARAATRLLAAPAVERAR